MITYDKIVMGLPEPYSDVNFLCRKKGWQMDFHSHSFYQFILITNGILRIICGNLNWTCKKGHLVIIPPGYAHALSTVEGYSQAGFNLKSLKDNRGVVQILEDNIKKPMLLEKASLLDLLPELNVCSCNLTQLYKLKTALLLDEIILKVIEEVSPHKNHDFTEKLLNIMQKDFSSKMSIDKISKELSISKTHLERMAMKEFGCGVMEFYNKLRINKACALLLDQSICIKEISSMLGFCDQAHFNRFFKSKVNYTPLQYRNQRLNS